MSDFFFYFFVLSGCFIVLLICLGVVLLGLNSLNAEVLQGSAELDKKMVDSTSFLFQVKINDQVVKLSVDKKKYDHFKEKDVVTIKYYIGKFDKKVYPIELME